MLIYLLIAFFISILIIQIFNVSKEGFGDTTSLTDSPTDSPITLSPITLSPIPTTDSPITLSPFPTTDSPTTDGPISSLSMAPVTGPSMDPSIPSRVAVLEEKVKNISGQVNALAASSNEKYTSMTLAPASSAEAIS